MLHTCGDMNSHLIYGDESWEFKVRFFLLCSWKCLQFEKTYHTFPFYLIRKEKEMNKVFINFNKP